MLAYVVDMLVYLICEHIHIRMFLYHISKSLELCLRIYRTCRVAWRAENQHTSLWSDSCLELLWCNLEVLVKACRNMHWCTTCEEYHLRIRHPVRCRYDNLLTVIYQRHYSVAHSLLGTVADEYLTDFVVKSVLFLQLCHDRLAEICIARHW